MTRRRKPKERGLDEPAKSYFDPQNTGSLGGQNRLTNALKNKVKGSNVKDWLQKTDTYTLHKPAKKKIQA